MIVGTPFEYKGHILYSDNTEDGWAEVRAINRFEAEEDERVRRILESEEMRRMESQRHVRESIALTKRENGEVDELTGDEKMFVKTAFEAYFGISVNELATESEVAGSLLKKLGVI